MKANDCQYFHLGMCTAPSAKGAAHRGCVLLDIRVAQCLWHVSGVRERRAVGRPNSSTLTNLNIPKFTESK